MNSLQSQKKGSNVLHNLRKKTNTLNKGTLSSTDLESFDLNYYIKNLTVVKRSNRADALNDIWLIRFKMFYLVLRSPLCVKANKTQTISPHSGMPSKYISLKLHWKLLTQRSSNSRNHPMQALYIYLMTLRMTDDHPIYRVTWT